MHPRSWAHLSVQSSAGSKPQAEAGGKPQSKVSSLTATPGSAADLRKGVQPGSFIDLLVSASVHAAIVRANDEAGFAARRCC